MAMVKLLMMMMVVTMMMMVVTMMRTLQRPKMCIARPVDGR